MGFFKKAAGYELLRRYLNRRSRRGYFGRRSYGRRGLLRRLLG